MRPGMRRVALLLAVSALAPLACGGDDDEAATSAPAPAPTTAERPTATTGEPPGARRGPPPGTRSYTCGGEELSTLPPDGPVTVEPEIVMPGDRFTVRVTAPGTREVLVSLAGASDQPVSASGDASGVTLTMPAGATCGNKLLTIEGDVSALAYVAVRG